MSDSPELPEQNDETEHAGVEKEATVAPPANITVKFQITNTQIIAHTYSKQLTFDEVKADIASKFKVDTKYLQILYCECPVENETRLNEVCPNDFGIIDVELRLLPEAEFDNIQLNVNVYYSHYTLPDIITVHVPLDDNEEAEGGTKELLVEIENKSIVKPFLGGYKNTKKNLEYHDAFTQTGPPLHRIKYDNVWCRETQTVELRNTNDDTAKDCASQAFGEAPKLIYESKKLEYSIEPKPYETHEMQVKREKKLHKITLIQKNFRAYMIRMMIKKKAFEFRKLLEEQRRRENMIEEIYVNRHKRECIIKTMPVTKEDFDVLYSQIAMWKQNEIKKISELHSGGPKIAALNCLLDNEITLLNGIEKQKLMLREKAQEQKNQHMLSNLGKPKEWIGYNDLVIKMDTLRTQKVRFLTEYYMKMKNVVDKDERFVLIDDIQNIVDRTNNPKIAAELEKLLWEEVELLKCDVDNSDLHPLRLRQQVFFLQLIKDEEHWAPEKPKTRMCDRCHTVRPTTEFAIETRNTALNVCKQCADLKVTVIDNSVYRAILRAVRREERKRGALSSYAFIIQEADLRFIIENIWHGHSILSQCSKRPDLRLPRWRIGDDWSPWNCICLTEHEARAHVKIKYLERVYEENLIIDIQNKNMLAKSAFKRLQAVDYEFVQSGEWWDVGLDGKTI